jgi:hypothetical protein
MVISLQIYNQILYAFLIFSIHVLIAQYYKSAE